MKRWHVITGGAVLAVLITVWIVAGGHGNGKSSTDKHSNVTDVQKEQMDGWVASTVQDDLFKKGEGEIAAWFPYGDNGFLVESKSGRNEYDEPFQADRIGWMVRDGNGYQAKWLTKGDHAVWVVQEGDSPFLKDGDNTWVILVPQNINGTAGKAVVYEIREDAAKKVYETKGDFLRIDRVKGKLNLVEKRYEMNASAFPSNAKPYTEYKTSYQAGTWTSTKGTVVTPANQ